MEESEEPIVSMLDEDRLLEIIDSVSKPDPENTEYFEQHCAELQEQYPGETVIIIGGEVVETIPSGLDVEETQALFDGVREEYGQDALDTAYTRFIRDPNVTYIPG